jgi:predicted GIY-YIG superfamily endonuclease
MNDTLDLVAAPRDLVLRPPELQLDRTIFARTGLSGCIPSCEGVYLFHDLRGVLYVGRSANLHRRFVQHLEHGQNPWLGMALSSPVVKMCFSWIQVEPGESNSLERSLIRMFRPPCNRTSLFDRPDGDPKAACKSRVPTTVSTIVQQEEEEARR